NLDKVKALTEEILPHLRSLKRQTSRWEKRDALEQELRMLENHFFGTEYQDLQTKTAQLEDELRGRRTEEERLREARRTAEDELKKVEAAQPEERKELTDIKQRTRGLLEKRSAIQKDLGRLEAQLEITGAPVGEEEDELPSAGALFALVKTIRNKLEAFTEDEVEYEELRDGIREILDDISETLSEGVPARRATPASGPDVREDFEKLNKELTELEKSLSALQEQEKVLEKSQEEFYLRFKVAVAAVETAKGHLEKWDSETQAKNFEKERLSLRLEDWARQVRQTGREPHEFENVTAAPELEGQTREAMEHRLFRLRGELAAIGEVDEALLKEARETETRYQFLSKESEDLEKAKTDLRKLILDLNDKIKTEFSSALHKINIEFDKFFNLMFDGGTAKLKLATPPKPKAAEEKEGEAAPAEEKVKDAVAEEALEDPAVEEGIEIDLKITRKRVNSLEMLSGGERSLVGIAALFALISVSPPPFLVLDEVDAPLDERNARRFSEMLKEFSKDTQFILVTHNRATMEAADVLYGITLNDDGTSKAVSLKLEKA
ncbi:MAG TPA: AAA family ATPase, partial [Candidatus Paceibacterota bacterium]|nr:AAA family ATPase [Candidatus Paceibacterota bacterium]